MGKGKLVFIAAVIIAGVVLILAFLTGLLQLGKEPDEIRDSLSIKSDDGLAELIIPEDALPGGVDFDDITITRAPGDQFGDDGPVVYELEPDGCQFTDPVLLKVSLGGDNDTLPMVFLSTSDGFDLVNNTVIEVDPRNKTQTLEIPITHFSELLIYSRHGVYQVKASAQSTYCGSPITTDSSFTLYKNTFAEPSRKGGVDDKSGRVIVVEVSNLYIKGFWRNGNREGWTRIHDEGITPIGEFGGKPGNTHVTVGQTVTFQDRTFRCTRSGARYLWYRVEVVSDIKRLVYESEEDYMAGRSSDTATRTYRNYRHEREVLVDFYCMAVQGCGEEEEEPRTDPGEQGPDVEVSYEPFYTDNDGLYTRSEIYVDITYGVGAKGTVTLNGASIQTQHLPVYIEKEGESRVTFIVHPRGLYTVIVEIGGHTIEKEILVYG